MMFIASIDCDVCANRKCAKIPKHYEELGCKEIKENEACCATRLVSRTESQINFFVSIFNLVRHVMKYSYECPDFKSYDTSKCHLRGKQYNVSDTLAENDAPIFLAACECHIHDKEPAAFECAIVECPEHFDGGDSSDECAENCTSTHNSTLCISIYENATSYCRIKEICGTFQCDLFCLLCSHSFWLNIDVSHTDENEIAMLPTCYYDDKVYHLGEKFEPIAHPCYECMCTETFDNATAIGDNANCAKLDCGIEVREMKNIRNGCVPVYYGRESCCPIEYRCRKWIVFLLLIFFFRHEK